MNLLLETGFGRMAIVSKFFQPAPYYQVFCKTLRQATDPFVLTALTRSVQEFVTDPELYRSLHALQPRLVQHTLDADALIAFRDSVLDRKKWVVKNYALTQDPPLFERPLDQQLYGLLSRTLDVLETTLTQSLLRKQYVGKEYLLIGPHNGHSDNTLVTCIAAVSETAIRVKPVVLTGNDSGFEVNLTELKPCRVIATIIA